MPADVRSGLASSCEVIYLSGEVDMRVLRSIVIAMAIVGASFPIGKSIQGELLIISLALVAAASSIIFDVIYSKYKNQKK